MSQIRLSCFIYRWRLPYFFLPALKNWWNQQNCHHNHHYLPLPIIHNPAVLVVRCVSLKNVPMLLSNANKDNSVICFNVIFIEHYREKHTKTWFHTKLDNPVDNISLRVKRPCNMRLNRKWPLNYRKLVVQVSQMNLIANVMLIWTALFVDFNFFFFGGGGSGGRGWEFKFR